MTTTTPVPTLDFDHRSPRVTSNREEVLKEVTQHPIFWTEAHGGYWVVTSYELSKRVLRDTTVFSSHKNEDMTGGVTIPTVAGPRLIPAELDPPYHRTLRRILTPKFHKNAIDRITPDLEKYIGGVIDDVAAMGEFDAVHDLADRIPAGSMVAMLGFSEESRVPFIESVQAVLDVLPNAGDPEFAKTERMQEGMVALEHAVGVINALIAERRRQPTGDLVSHLVSEEFALPDDEVLWLTFTLLVGGAENPAAMISNSLVHLAQDTELRSRLAANHSLIPAACEELLRQTSSAVSLARNVMSDVEIAGAQIRKGQRILVWLPGANYDTSLFESPEKVDIDRPSCPHIAFGDGPHVCVGNTLFRAWFNILLKEVLTKMPDYTLDIEHAQRHEISATRWGWRTLPAKANR